MKKDNKKKLAPGEELLDQSGRYSVPVETKRKGFKVNKKDWPRFVIHNYAGRL